MIIVAIDPYTLAIKLSNSDKSVLIDVEDYDKIKDWKWRIDPKGYAVSGTVNTTIRMHRLIMCPREDVQIDHINRDKLDNRKSNLREASNMQNQWNVGKRKVKTSSRYKGVHLRKGVKGKRWQARIAINGKRVSLGHFYSEEEAANIYNEFAWIYHGEFAVLNK